MMKYKLLSLILAILCILCMLSMKLEAKTKIPERIRFIDAHDNVFDVPVYKNASFNKYKPNRFTLSPIKVTDNKQVSTGNMYSIPEPTLGNTRCSGIMKYSDWKYTSRAGVDVSRYQEPIDWQQVKAAGFDFAIIRIGYRGYSQAGKIVKDTSFDEHILSAHNAGMDIGVYFFAQAVNEEEAIEEADKVIEWLHGYEPDLGVIYDPESIQGGGARTDNVNGVQFTKNAIAFCERIKEAGLKPMIYSNMVWEGTKFDMGRLSEYPFWYADYCEKPQTPYAFDIWQYSESGIVPGIKGVVDLDIQILER